MIRKSYPTDLTDAQWKRIEPLVPPTKRWAVERTFAWLYKYRWLSKDYEYLPAWSESYNYIAMIHLMAKWLE